MALFLNFILAQKENKKNAKSAFMFTKASFSVERKTKYVIIGLFFTNKEKKNTKY